MKGIAEDHPHTVIGLFDFDEPGVKEYKMNRNFVELEIGGYKVNKGIHGKAYAALLPIPSFRADCGNHENLPIEFLFRDEYLTTEVDGNRLTLKRKQASRKVGSKLYKLDLDNFTHLKDISGGKTEFADAIVPTLPHEAFEAFNAVFELILAIIESAKASSV